ncbi:MAG: hypothetical protein IT174_00570 [Acidobacteria bacterium]|nr:hypothetical protein [Acidobacteriota bacterium]
MKRLLVLLLLLTTACSGPSADDVIAKERAESFAAFQTHVDQNYPGWSVTAIRQDDLTFGTDSTMREQYYVVMKKDNDEKIVFLVKAQFVNKAGETVSQIYKPVYLPPDHPEAMQDDR